jgi:ABC-2 type transport system permease protein
VTAPGTPGSAALVRLVAAREMSTRIRDKTFLITSGVILLLVLGGMAFQVLIASGADKVRSASSATRAPSSRPSRHRAGLSVPT